MVRIVKTDGTVLGLTEQVNYIRVGDSGSYTNACEKTATGIAFDGVAYSLNGGIPDIEEVTVSEVDAGQIYVTAEDMANAIREGVNNV